MQHEIQISIGQDAWFVYVTATDADAACIAARASLNANGRRWANVFPTGR